MLHAVSRDRKTVASGDTYNFVLTASALLDEAGLSSALSWYTEGLSERSGIKIHLDIPEDFGRLLTTSSWRCSGWCRNR